MERFKSLRRPLIILCVLIVCALAIAAPFTNAQQTDSSKETTVGGWEDAMHFSSGTVISCNKRQHEVRVLIDADSTGCDKGDTPTFYFKESVDISWVEPGVHVYIHHWSPYKDPTIPTPAVVISQTPIRR